MTTKEKTFPVPITKQIERILRPITQFFVLVGALSWGVYGFYKVNPIEAILGDTPAAASFYLVTALSALYIGILKVLMKA